MKLMKGHMVSIKKIVCWILICSMIFLSFQTNSIVFAAESEQDEIPDQDGITYWNGFSALKFQKGKGTQEDPYIISNGNQLKYFANEVGKGNTFVGSYILLDNDIYLNQISDYEQWSEDYSPQNIWEGIQGQFAGTFDGNGHTIYGMYIKDPGDNVGFFRMTSRGQKKEGR